MDKAELSAATESEAAAEGAQLLAAVLAVPSQSRSEGDDAQMARLADQPLPLISFLVSRQRVVMGRRTHETISPRLVFEVQRPDLAEPPLQPRPRRAVPAEIHRDERPLPTLPDPPIFAFEPSARDRDEAFDVAPPDVAAMASGVLWPAVVCVLVAACLVLLVVIG